MFKVSGIRTASTKAEIGSTLWTDRRNYKITHLPGDLAGSMLFRPKHYVNRGTISVSSTNDAYIWVALLETRDGGLMDVLATEGWTLKEGWYVQWSNNNEKLNKIWSKQIAAGETVTFTTTEDRMTFAIFALEGTNFL